MNVRTTGAAALILLLAASFPAWAEDISWPDLSRPAKAVGGGKRDAAVIVGIDEYAFVEHVPGARQNADDWQSYLTGTLQVPADRVVLLLDNDGTLEEIRRAAEEKAGQVEPGGTLWFIFIGHGAPSKDGKDGLLIGADAQQKAESVYSRGLSRNELLGVLAKGRQAKSVVLLDACFSGKSSSGQALIAGLQPLITMRSLPLGIDARTVLMTAAKSDQFAGPLPGGSRPAFSYLALGALRGWAAGANGEVTAGGLVDYARRSLSLARDRTQTPELATPETAQVVLGSGHESGPDLARLQREAAAVSGGVSQVANLPAVRRTGEAGIKWARIPGGTFMMGSAKGNEQPAHRVAIKSFQMAKTEVTNKQYRACVAAGACAAAHYSDGICYVDHGNRWGLGNLPDSFQGDDQPVVCVDWEEAKNFSAWAGGRLPSEAEWEYAARGAGRDQKYPWGDADATCERAAIAGCGSVTAPVCSKPAGNTKQGLCDMTGNAWEWVQDTYQDSYNGAPTDGRAWEGQVSPPARVMRGGSWFVDAEGSRSASRTGIVPYGRGANLGFRLVR